MRRPTRCIASLILLPLAGWPAAAAPPSQTALVATADPALPDPGGAPSLPDFRMPRGDYRQPPGPIRNGLIGAVPIGRDAHVALGRFSVPNFSAPRIEPADVRRRDRNLAAIGVSIRF